MANEVVAHYLDGRVVKGVSLDVDPGRPVCHIRTPAEGTLEVKLKDLKALFFVQDLAGNSGRSDVLALASQVSRSDFRPKTLTTDGAYLIEDGTWSFTHRRTQVSARYDLRWRRAGGKWQVSFLKWELFR